MVEYLARWCSSLPHNRPTSTRKGHTCLSQVCYPRMQPRLSTPVTASFSEAQNIDYEFGFVVLVMSVVSVMVLDKPGERSSKLSRPMRPNITAASCTLQQLPHMVQILGFDVTDINSRAVCRPMSSVLSMWANLQSPDSPSADESSYPQLPSSIRAQLTNPK